MRCSCSRSLSSMTPLTPEFSVCRSVSTSEKPSALRSASRFPSGSRGSLPGASSIVLEAGWSA
jgi:hypothetical protein